jgi:hypothetical protein
MNVMVEEVDELLDEIENEKVAAKELAEKARKQTTYAMSLRAAKKDRGEACE